MAMAKFVPHEDLLALDEKERIRWAEALESGDYKQGTGALFDPKCGYCCLGVWESINGATDSQMATCSRPSTMELRAGGAEATLIDDGRPESVFAAKKEDKIGDEVSYFPLRFMSLNDSIGMSFDQIAQILRGNSVEVEVATDAFDMPDALGS